MKGGMNRNNPYQRYRAQSVSDPNALKFTEAVPAPTGGPSGIPGEKDGPQVQFPDHLFPPKGVSTLDVRRVATLNPAETVTLIDIVCPANARMRITHYAIFNDGNLEQDYLFVPEVDGRRVYPWHGINDDPNNPNVFNIRLGLSPDLANQALIMGPLDLQPGQRLTWTVTNNSLVATDMGVRVVGFLDYSSKRVPVKFGG